MKVKVYYDVHSKIDDSFFVTFTGRGAKQKAIAYAKANKGLETYVDRAMEDTTYGYSEWDYECVWSYDWDKYLIY